MKKLPILSAAAVLFTCTFLCGCSVTYQGMDALFEKAREELQVSDADTIDLRLAGECWNEDSVLMCFVSGNEYQAHSYLALEFLSKGEDCYEYIHTYRPFKRGMDICVQLWKNEYVFLVNNRNCTTIRITDKTGTQDISIEEDAYPYVFYYEHSVSGYSFEYVFLDKDGNEIK